MVHVSHTFAKQAAAIVLQKLPLASARLPMVNEIEKVAMIGAIMATFSLPLAIARAIKATFWLPLTMIAPIMVSGSQKMTIFCPPLAIGSLALASGSFWQYKTPILMANPPWTIDKLIGKSSEVYNKEAVG